MVDGVRDDAPLLRSVRVMDAFDALPVVFRQFLPDYPRGVKADQAAALLAACGGDVDEAIREIRALVPVRRS